MGDDIGWFNIGAYHRGMMSGKTPNIDRLAKEGVMFTDYYAEASCTAGRANFITGMIPMRTGMTTVGQAGSPIGLPAEAPAFAAAAGDPDIVAKLKQGKKLAGRSYNVYLDRSNQMGMLTGKGPSNREEIW